VAVNPLVFVLAGSLLAAAGQLFLKLGASGATQLADYLNARLLIGFVLYAAGSVLWVMALAKLPLSRVYPFTVLTFVMVYVASFAILGERLTSQVISGAVLVLVGLVVIATG
jgi:drug/metabolite transporter (DMT)-like permease